jgi:periplasmic protein TonB
VILRQTLPFPLDEQHKGAPPHIRLAVALSLGLHVAVVAYVAYMKFNPPQAEALPQGPVYNVPLVDWKQPQPPEPTPPRPTPPIHETVPFPNPPVTPLHIDPVLQDPAPPIGPVAKLDPPQTVVEPPARDPVIRDPRWISQPGADEFARFYPERALRMGKEGEATLRCQVSADGRLHDCQVSGETPQNFGFGQAAIKLARYMRIAPKTVDGRPVDGGALIEPIKFRLK